LVPNRDRNTKALPEHFPGNAFVKWLNTSELWEEVQFQCSFLLRAQLGKRFVSCILQITGYKVSHRYVMAILHGAISFYVSDNAMRTVLYNSGAVGQNVTYSSVRRVLNSTISFAVTQNTCGINK
jgi:hypothetical protein